MTYTKQPLNETITGSKNDIEEHKTPEKPDPKVVLLDSLGRLYAELDDFQKEAEKFFKYMKKSQKQEIL